MSTFVSNILYELSSTRGVRSLNSILCVWFAFVVWLSSDAGMGLGAVMLLLLSGLVLAAVSSAQLYAHRRIREDDSPDRWLVQKLNPTLLALALVFCLTGAPFYLRFVLSKSSLSAYVASLEGRNASHASQRVGLFFVRETETRDGAVRLITSEDGMMNDAGLVYSPSGAPKRVGEDVYAHIAGPWWHWRRSW